MKLYDFSLAYNPGKARLVLVEKGLPFETVNVNLLNGESLNPQFLKINPTGTLPVLEDEGQKITESRLIVEYVDAKGGDTIGGAGADRAEVGKWMDKLDAWDGNLFVTGTVKGPVKGVLGSIESFRLKYAQARKEENPDMAEVYTAKIEALKRSLAKGEDAAAIQQNKQQLGSLLDEADVQLAKTPFLAGSAYSIADVMLTAVLQRITSIGGAGAEAKYIAPRAKVAAYYEVVKARPSFSKVYSASPTPVLGALGRAVVGKLTGRY